MMRMRRRRRRRGRRSKGRRRGKSRPYPRPMSLPTVCESLAAKTHLPDESNRRSSSRSGSDPCGECTCACGCWTSPSADTLGCSSTRGGSAHTV